MGGKAAVISSMIFCSLTKFGAIFYFSLHLFMREVERSARQISKSPLSK
ncbi:hypothetical protein NT08PM_0776 [Pasteurella multocida subsp. multocida str. 3480]|nr:hypothetical protein NT08PM_0776 [Pasteurella multocida subsp. multocida str. 3480]